ncbi:hypothetical protein [Aeoliella sp.]|uniref:hypothetical protein n=1 Tax=Aeoliella sp. TaxID=2795800 RepID=UPI003CCB8489
MLNESGRFEAIPRPEADPQEDFFIQQEMVFSDLRLSVYRDSAGVAATLLDLLPTPNDPSDMQSSDLLRTKTIRTYTPVATYGATAVPVAGGTVGQLGIQGTLGFFYDTGYAGGTNVFSPANIAIDGTSAAHNRGQFKFVDANLTGLPVRVQLGTQSRETAVGLVATYAEIYNGDGTNGFDVRRGYVRLVDPTVTHSVALGKFDPLLGDPASLPIFLIPESRPIGAVGNVDVNKWKSIPQVRYSFLMDELACADDRLEWSLSMEDQSILSDVPSPAGGATLQRYPAFATRLRYQPSTQGFASFQVGAVARPIGVEDAAFVEYFEPGWGIATMGRFELPTQAVDAVYFGVCGGKGTGGYIWNGTNAANFASGTLNTLSNFGAFTAYQRFWGDPQLNNNLLSNFIIGYVQGDAPAATDTQTLHQMAANLIWNFSATSAVAVEYQYGRREVGSGATGDDHRIMFGLQFTPSKTREGDSGSTAAAPAFGDDGPSFRNYGGPSATPQMAPRSQRSGMSSLRL